MSSRTGQPARRAAVSLFPALILALGLAACGGGGQSPAPATLPHAEDPFAPKAAPGEIVVLQPSGELLGAPVSTYAWSQVAGPAVELEDAGRPQAHFVMPGIEEGERLTFVLTVERASGEVVAEERSVECGREGRAGHRPPPAVPPDFAVFVASKDLATRADLYLARLDGSEVFRLNGPMAPGGIINVVAISPDRRYVAYIADEETVGTLELFVAAPDGGVVNAAISGPLTAGGDVFSFLTR